MFRQRCSQESIGNSPYMHGCQWQARTEEKNIKAKKAEKKAVTPTWGKKKGKTPASKAGLHVVKNESVAVGNYRYYIIIRPTHAYIERKQNGTQSRVRIVGVTNKRAAGHGKSAVCIMNTILSDIENKPLSKPQCVQRLTKLLA